MKNQLIVLIIILISSYSYSQIEIIGGINKNHFFDFNKDEGHFGSTYTAGNGYFAGIAYNTIIDSLPIKFSLYLENYKGNLNTHDGGMGGLTTTNASVSKNVIGIGIYPLNLHYHGLKLSVGGDLNFLVFDKTIGYKESWTGFGPSMTYTYKTIDNHNVKINNSKNLGLGVLVSYHIYLFCSWSVYPQIKLFYGLSNDIINTEAKINSFRTTFSLGISKGKCKQQNPKI